MARYRSDSDVLPAWQKAAQNRTIALNWKLKPKVVKEMSLCQDVVNVKKEFHSPSFNSLSGVQLQVVPFGYFGVISFLSEA